MEISLSRPPDWAVIECLAERVKCLQCKTRFERPFLFEVEPGNWTINPDLLDHMHATHGIPVDVYRDAIRDGCYGL